MSRYRSLEDPDTLRKFVHNLRKGMYITNPEGDLLDANPAVLRCAREERGDQRWESTRREQRR